MKKGSNLPETVGKAQVFYKGNQNEGGLVSYRNRKKYIKKDYSLNKCAHGCAS